MTRFSRPVKNGSTAAYWPDKPISRRTAAGFLATSNPATHARPRSGLSNVARIRTIVVFPAPLGPSTPSTPPAGNSRSTPSSAATGPKRLPSPSATIAAPAIACLLAPPASHPMSRIATYLLTCSITTYEGGGASPQGAPGHAAAGQPGERAPARVCGQGNAPHRQRRPVRPSHRHHLPGPAAAGGGRAGQGHLVRSGRPPPPDLSTHPGRATAAGR